MKIIRREFTNKRKKDLKGAKEKIGLHIIGDVKMSP